MLLYKNLKEDELLALVQAGDYTAFNELYHRYWDILFGSAYNIFRDRDACMDILQDVFVWFWEHREQWKLTSCKGYLLTAVKFKVANYIRNNKVRESFFQQLEKLDTDADSAHLILEVAELKKLIKRFSEQLPDRCREIFQLSRYDDLSNKEIAVKLGISEKTVENQMTIALKKLKEKLGPGNLMSFFI